MRVALQEVVGAELRNPRASSGETSTAQSWIGLDTRLRNTNPRSDALYPTGGDVRVIRTHRGNLL